MDQVQEFLSKQGLVALWAKINQENSKIVNAIKEIQAIATVPIYYDTKENWNSSIERLSEKGSIYIYSNYQNKDGKDIPGIKIGDGSAYLIDLPFIDTAYFEHINNSLIHTNGVEKAKWNNKVSCQLSETDSETIIFTDN